MKNEWQKVLHVKTCSGENQVLTLQLLIGDHQIYNAQEDLCYLFTNREPNYHCQ